MLPTYPYEPGTVANDWRNAIIGTLAGAKPSDAIGVDGNYFLDLDTGLMWGPKEDSAWPNAGVSLFHNVNAVFGATNGSAPSNTVGVNGDYFIDYQTSSVFGPKASGAWPGSPVVRLIGPANVIFGDSGDAPPSNAIGLDGFYFFDVSASKWYGPKASGAWPPAPSAVAGGVNTLFGDSGGAAPSNDLGIEGSYFYDTSSQKYYGPKTNVGWPTESNGYLSPQNDSNTVSGAASGNKPSNDVGRNGEYFVDGDTGKIWGPKSGGAWPITPRFKPYEPPPSVPEGTTYDGNTITGNTGGNAPAGTVGLDGDYFMDTSSGKVWGPKAGGAWPGSPAWVPYRASATPSSTNWTIGTRVRGLIYNKVHISLFDILTVTKVFGAASNLIVNTTIAEAALGGDTVSTVGFDTDKTFVGPWGAINAGAIPMAVGQTWQVVDSQALAGIDPRSGNGWLGTAQAGLHGYTEVAPWGYIPKRTSPIRESVSGYPIGILYDTRGFYYVEPGEGSDRYLTDAPVKYNTAAPVDITLLRLT